MTQGFWRSEIDHYLYTKRVKDTSLILLALYVDHMMLASKSTYELNALKAKLHEAFDMKDLGSASHILGMHITCDWSRKLIWHSQMEYITKVLQHFNMEGGKAVSTPLPP